MRFTSPTTRRSIPALIGGLIAVLLMLVFTAPANASIIPPTNDLHQVPDTTAAPYRSVVEIVLGYADTGPNKGKTLGACTGWLYASNMVATAGHCVFDPTDAAAGYISVTGMRVWPAINGSTSSAPYGSCGVVASYANSTYVSTYNNYPSTTEGDVNYDYGALRLDCPVGDQTGVLTYDGNGSPPDVGYSTRVVGYPHNGTLYPTDTQWYSDGSVYTYDDHLVYYDNDTEHRMSGAPVMEWTGSAFKVVAIHSRDWSTSYNTGPRISSAVVNDLYNWWYYG